MGIGSIFVVALGQRFQSWLLNKKAQRKIHLSNLLVAWIDQIERSGQMKCAIVQCSEMIPFRDDPYFDTSILVHIKNVCVTRAKCGQGNMLLAQTVSTDGKFTAVPQRLQSHEQIGIHNFTKRFFERQWPQKSNYSRKLQSNCFVSCQKPPPSGTRFTSPPLKQ